jgi:hypothetical protein
LANTSGLAQSFIDAVHSASPQDKTWLNGWTAHARP